MFPLKYNNVLARGRKRIMRGSEVGCFETRKKSNIHYLGRLCVRRAHCAVASSHETRCLTAARPPILRRPTFKLGLRRPTLIQCRILLGSIPLPSYFFLKQNDVSTIWLMDSSILTYITLHRTVPRMQWQFQTYGLFHYNKLLFLYFSFCSDFSVFVSFWFILRYRIR